MVCDNTFEIVPLEVIGEKSSFPHEKKYFLQPQLFIISVIGYKMKWFYHIKYKQTVCKTEFGTNALLLKYFGILFYKTIKGPLQLEKGKGV
jgi:hypothetical protein